MGLHGQLHGKLYIFHLYQQFTTQKSAILKQSETYISEITNNIIFGKNVFICNKWKVRPRKTGLQYLYIEKCVIIHTNARMILAGNVFRLPCCYPKYHKEIQCRIVFLPTENFLSKSKAFHFLMENKRQGFVNDET